MVLASLQHGGEEQLAQRHGLQAYAENGSTMGVPLLHPWANRLGEPHYQLSLTFGDGYRFAQVFSPPEADYVCFEPMTAPTNALLSGPPGLSLVTRGQDYQAAFEISSTSARAA